MKNISSIINQPTGHKNFDFIDVDLDKDNMLFIDPCLIEVGMSNFCRKANRVMQDCMDHLVSLYRDHSDDREKLAFYDHMHELNYTRLGYGNGRNGKAKTAWGMIQTLRGLQELVDKNIRISKPIDIPIMIKGFAEDCMSDMLTNILFKELNSFTLKQCEKYGLTKQRCREECYYWDKNCHEWRRYHGEVLYIDDQLILMVPKEIVRRSYYYNTEQYFRRIVLERLQQDKTEYDSNGKEIKPTKQELKKELLESYSDVRDITVDKTIERPELLDLHHRQMTRLYSGRQLSDAELDGLIYLGV